MSIHLSNKHFETTRRQGRWYQYKLIGGYHEKRFQQGTLRGAPA